MYLNLQARQDWTSVMEAENNSDFLSFGGSVALIATDAFPSLQNEILNYAKVRVGFGHRLISFSLPYTYNLTHTKCTSLRSKTESSNPMILIHDWETLDLTLELISEFEVGIDTRLWDNRINLNVSF